VGTLPKQARAQRTYDRVLGAAAEEFARHGYAEANLQRIADRIGLTKGALYGHFASKEDLAGAFADHLSHVTGELLARYETPSGPPLEELRGLVLGTAALLQEDDRAHAAFRLAAEEAHVTGVPVSLPERMRQTVGGLVALVQQEGVWDSSLAPAPLADLIVAAVFGVYWAGAVAERASLTARVGSMWELLAHVLTRSSRAASGAGGLP
jgi:AcrR family transcriptional regulator